MSEVSGHVSSQNGSQICPSTQFDMGLFPSLSQVYVPNSTLGIDGLMGINVNFGHL